MSKNDSENMIYKAFKTKIYPTKEQIEYFNKCFGITRFAYNWFIEKREIYYQQGIKKSFYDLRKEFHDSRETEFPFVFEVNSRVYGSALGNANAAYKNFIKYKKGFPKYKSKKNPVQSFNYDRCLLDVSDSKFSKVKKYKSLFNKKNFYIAGQNKNCGQYMNGYFIKTSENISFLKDKQIFQITISYDNLNYYVSFQYKELKENKYNNYKYDKVGIDLGLKTFAMQSDNKTSKLPKQKIIKIEKRINRLQRILSKKQYNSNNYNKVRIKLNKCYKKNTNIRRDFLNKYTTWLCKNYKEIHIENLNIFGMLKNHRMAKAIKRSGFYEFKEMLLQKSKFYDNKIVLVDTWYASSKICHCCGNKKKSLKLSDRIYICDKCGYIQDRDLNAALNIRDWNN